MWYTQEEIEAAEKAQQADKAEKQAAGEAAKEATPKDAEQWEEALLVEGAPSFHSVVAATGEHRDASGISNQPLHQEGR